MPAIAPLIPIAIELTMSLIKAAREAKEMDEQQFNDIRKKIDMEFEIFPKWSDL